MTLCGPAKKCCHMKYTPPTKKDECRCGCGMLNGVFQLLCGQFLLFVGFWFSAATVGDCQLVELDEPIQVREDGVLSNQVGLFSYQQTVDETGSDQQASQISCYYWFETETIVGEKPFDQLDGAEQLQYYIQTVLGSQWYPSILLLSLSTILALLVFLYVMSYCCSTQVFPIRFFTGLFISIILTLLQGLGTYLIYSSEWCNNSGDEEFGGGYCTMGRSTIFSIVAGCCYLFSGLFFISTSDYPGIQQLQESRCHDEEAATTNKENDRSATVPGAAAPDADADADDDADAVGVTSAAVTAKSTEEEDEVIYDPPQQQHDENDEEEQNSVLRDINYNSYEEDKKKNNDASSSASSSVLEQHDYLPRQQQQESATTSSSRNLAEENDKMLVALTALTNVGKSLQDVGPVDPPQSVSIRDQEEEKQEIVGEEDEEAAAAVAMIENTMTYQEEEGEEILLLDTLQSQDDEEPSYSFRSLGSSENDDSEFIPRPPSPQ